MNPNKQSLTVIKEEHFGIARKIVSNMTLESWQNIPHCVITHEPQVDKFLDILKEINEGKSKEEKITINTAMLRVLVEAIKACPILNSHMEFDQKYVRGCIKSFKEINISMPMILKSGEMMTINMHNMHEKTMSQMRDSIADKAKRANNSIMEEAMYEVSLNDTLTKLSHGHIVKAINRVIGSLTGKHKIKTLKGKAKKDYYSIPENERITKHDIEQGTITISNLGSACRNWKGVCTILEIIPPQVCAIGIGAVQLSAIAHQDGTVTAGKIMPITLAFDHKAIDMGDVTPFVDKLNEIFENPEVIKEWV